MGWQSFELRILGFAPLWAIQVFPQHYSKVFSFLQFDLQPNLPKVNFQSDCHNQESICNHLLGDLKACNWIHCLSLTFSISVWAVLLLTWYVIIISIYYSFVQLIGNISIHLPRLISVNFKASVLLKTLLEQDAWLKLGLIRDGIWHKKTHSLSRLIGVWLFSLAYRW